MGALTNEARERLRVVADNVFFDDDTRIAEEDDVTMSDLRALLADSDSLGRAERERDEAVRQARLSSLANTPEWNEARSPKQLAELMRHMGYADGDSGYTLRYLSYEEMGIIRAALLAMCEPAPKREVADA